jgi:replicative DNA helicase
MSKYAPSIAGKVTLEEVDRRQSLTPLTFGTAGLDAALVPMTAGDLVSVVARPGMGKTLFLVHLTNHLQQQGASVAYVTYETSVTEFTCLRLGIKLEDVGRGQIPRQEIKDKIAGSVFDKVTIFGQAEGELAPTLDEVIKQIGKDKYDVVLVDYLQRIRGSYHQDRHQQVSENAERLKDLALKMDIPVVMAVQARREVDNYNGLKFPGLNDAQWSSNIEQTSDKVLSLTRPRYYLTENIVTVDNVEYEVKSETVAIQVTKQRWSVAGHTVMLEADFKSMSLQDATGKNKVVF